MWKVSKTPRLALYAIGGLEERERERFQPSREIKRRSL